MFEPNFTFLLIREESYNFDDKVTFDESVA